MPPSPLSTTDLLAPCGLWCGACTAFLRKRNPCPGCNAPDKNKPPTRVVCTIKRCERLRNGFCDPECPETPCHALKLLEKRYTTKYHTSPTANLAAIQQSGPQKVASAEKERWTCPDSDCGGVVCMHTAACSVCGREIPS
ncbi:MAG: DUF3795 domain-containing protein [Desulfovibrio sp.]|nr:MAG: DUF3795 domain-containing protein [Desulfovibrio sp.]